MNRAFSLIFLFLLSSSVLRAQTVTDTVPVSGDTLRLVEILYADKQGYKKVDSVTELQLLVGHVQVKQDKTYFYCDSAVYNRNTKMLEAFGNVHINDNDSVHTYAQYLQYFTDTRIAYLRKKVKLTDGKSNLLSDELQYDVGQKIGEYHKGGKVISGSSVLTSKDAVYYTDLKEVYFKNDVVLKDPQYSMKTDSLLYNTEQELATFIALTTIIDSANRKIKTREGFYDLKNKKAYFAKRAVIEDGAVTITANEIETDDKTGMNRLKGNAVYKDTAQGIAVLANLIEANREEGQFRATLHPLMIIKQEEDSIYVTADTLFSGKLSRLYAGDSVALKDTIKGRIVLDAKANKQDSSDRYFQAYRHVRIFSDSLQAVSDSLFYSAKDSIFQLFQKPIVWSSDNQVTGDTILLYTRNKKADRLYVYENGLLVNKAGEGLFNQIKGNRLNGFFKEGVIDYMRAKGNAESVYYIKDEDSSFVGVNKASGDIIDLRFKDKELNRVVFVNEVKGIMYPMRQFPESEKTLRNFQWHDQLRPKNKFELFGD